MLSLQSQDHQGPGLPQRYIFLLCIYKDGNTSMMQLQIDMYNTTILIYGKINKIVALQTNFPLKAEYEYERSLF
jgi:hypothetical protein